MHLTLWMALILSIGCARAKSEPSPSEPTSPQTITYANVETRLPEFMQQGFVHSIDAGGKPISQGDGLFFTGLALYGEDCDHGAPLASAIETMFTSTGGAIYRDPSLPTQSVLDAALAMYRGVAKRVERCGELATWAPLIAKHMAYMAAHGDTLNVDGSRLDGGFDYIRDLLAYKLGVGTEPSYPRQQALEDVVVTTWTLVDVKARAACYRAHLALLALQTIEELGGTVTATARNAYCQATQGVGMVTADHWCGRQDLGPWMAAFKYDVWDYQPQRCTLWELPDGNGDARPAVDYLVAYEDQTRA